MYQRVIELERSGRHYLGKTVQMVPHLTNAIIEHIERVSRVPVDDTNETPDVCIIELGGTIGDLESAVFIEALRQLRRKVGKDNFLQIHVSLIPVIHGELKSKPTQTAIREVRSLGLSPDLIACRCSKALDEGTINKIALYCDVERTQVVSVTDVASLYHVPLLLESQGLITLVSDLFRLDSITASPSLVKRGAQIWQTWRKLTISQDHLYKSVTIAMVGKYTDHPDSYHSVVKSLEHAAMACARKLELIIIDASHLEKAKSISAPKEYHRAWSQVHTADGLLIPGGYDERGCEGMIAAIEICRKQKTPFLGICLGLQLATIEFARNECDLPLAASAEWKRETALPLITYMPEIDREKMGETARLGNRPTIFRPGSEWSKIYKLYRQDQGSSLSTVNGTPISSLTNGNMNSTVIANGAATQSPTPSSSTAPLIINERHRHRYEVNPEYVEQLEKGGLQFVGRDDKGERMEILELKDHPYFVGVQFHPEFLSRVLRPSKPFLGLVAASVGILEDILGGELRLAEEFEGVQI